MCSGYHKHTHRAKCDAGVRKLDNILQDVISRKGYAQGLWHQECDAAWQQSAGPQIARATRIGNLRSGVLEVFVKNSTVLQELTFRQTDLLQQLHQLLPAQRIEGLRFRVGSVD